MVTSGVIAFKEGEAGDYYDIYFYKPDGVTLDDLTGYTAAVLRIFTRDRQTLKKAITLNVANLVSGSFGRWVMTTTDTDFYGTYLAEAEITASGKSKKTYDMEVNIGQKAPSA